MSLRYYDTPGAVYLLITYNSGDERWEEKILLPRVILSRGRRGSLCPTALEGSDKTCSFGLHFPWNAKVSLEEREGEIRGQRASLQLLERGPLWV